MGHLDFLSTKGQLHCVSKFGCGALTLPLASITRPKGTRGQGEKGEQGERGDIGMDALRNILLAVWGGKEEAMGGRWGKCEPAPRQRPGLKLQMQPQKLARQA